MKRLRLLLAAILALSSWISCIDPEREEGDVTIRFTTGGLQHTKSVADSVADGRHLYADNNGVPDLIILIAAGDGSIVKRYDGAYPLRSQGVLESETLTDTEAAVSFNFSGDTAGVYRVYAFGNTRGLWSMTTDGENTISADDLSNASVISSADQLEALAFRPLALNTDPTRQNGRLPLSAKGTLEVKSNKNGDAHLELLRCVSKVTARIINNTGAAMELYNYNHKVYGICPDRGYVLPHDPDAPGGTNTGYLEADPCTKYGNPDFYVPISSEGSQDYDWYVFPSTGPYTIDVTFTLFKGEENEHTYTYNGLAVTNWKAENIPALRRNQHLIVETRISKGLTVSFNFIVADWVQREESVQFD